MLVKQVTTHEHEVQVRSVPAYLEALFKTSEGVIGTDLVILLVAQVIVRRYHDVEDVVLLDAVSIVHGLIDGLVLVSLVSFH